MELDEPLFNSSKRRKFIRKRQGTSPSPNSPPNTSQAEKTFDGPISAQVGDASEALPVEALRARRALRTRRPGIEFSAETRHTPETRPIASAEEAGEALSGRLGGISDRFIGLTGQRVDVDKHMMAYIESEISKRHRQSPVADSVSNQACFEGHTRQEREMRLPQRQPATLGKLHEIDLGPDSKLRNIERTEAATRSLVGGELTSQVDGRDTLAKRGRLDKDGKPWRYRNRRNSDDIRRDQLVEEVLRESKLDVYEEPEQEHHDGDQAADDRIAEQFRRDFLDAIQSRRRGVRSKATKSTKSDAPRGPKLGGSRSARAAMREKQEKDAKK
ncbi:hypothetical protein LOZ65_000979 [Ophidiomyces ophidiicola]|nr:hypothetical protein LOZ65_000979 [Ophidiomyces ophidiicola]